MSKERTKAWYFSKRELGIMKAALEIVISQGGDTLGEYRELANDLQMCINGVL